MNRRHCFVKKYGAVVGEVFLFESASFVKNNITLFH